MAEQLTKRSMQFKYETYSQLMKLVTYMKLGFAKEFIIFLSFGLSLSDLYSLYIVSRQSYFIAGICLLRLLCGWLVHVFKRDHKNKFDIVFSTTLELQWLTNIRKHMMVHS